MPISGAYTQREREKERGEKEREINVKNWWSVGEIAAWYILSFKCHRKWITNWILEPEFIFFGTWSLYPIWIFILHLKYMFISSTFLHWLHRTGLGIDLDQCGPWPVCSLLFTHLWPINGKINGWRWLILFQNLRRWSPPMWGRHVGRVAP